MAEKENKEQYVQIEEKDYRPRWTFAKYLKAIVRYKWWVIGFSAVGLLAGLLGTKYLYNPRREALSATFTYNLAGTNVDNDTIRFIDGTSFNIYDLSTLDCLKEVKNSDSKFKDINVENLAKSSAINISKNVSYYNKDDASTMYVDYTISTGSKAFPSVSIGKDFIYALINLPKKLSTEAIANYDAISLFPENFYELTFERQIGKLIGQFELDSNVYDSLVKTFSGTVVGNQDGKTISDIQSEFSSHYYTASKQSFYNELLASLSSNKYVNYTVGQEDEAIKTIQDLCLNYIQTISDYNKEVAIYEEALNEIVSSTTEIRDAVASEVARLSRLITDLKVDINELENELEDHGYFLDKDPLSPTYGQYVFDELNTNTTIYHLTHKDSAWVNGCQTFKVTIQGYRTLLEEDRASATETFRFCYSSYRNRVNIQDGGYVKASSGLSSVLVGAVGLVLAFAVTSLIVAAVYVNKEDK